MIGKQLTVLREEKGWHQKTLADMLGLSASTISSYERDNSEPDDETKIKIAKLFNVSLDYLMGATQLRIPFIRSDAIELPDNYPLELIPDVKKYIKVLYDSYLYEQKK